MNNLIPERRTDKNGVTSTKWIKPASEPTTSKALPAPQLITPLDDTATVAVSELVTLGYDLDAYPSTAHNMRFLAKHEPFVLQQLMKNARDTDPEGLAALGRLIEENPLPDASESNSHDEALIKPIANYCRIGRNLSLSRRLGTTDRLSDIARITESAVGMSYLEADISRGQATMILNKVTGHPIYDVVDYQSDDIHFIAENLEKVIPLIPNLLQRKEASRGIIEALWESEHSSLNDGIL